jgi:hypothetical protein
MSKRTKRVRISYKEVDDFVSDFESGADDDIVDYKPNNRAKTKSKKTTKTTKSKKTPPTVIFTLTQPFTR